MHHIVNVLQLWTQKKTHQEAVLYLEDGEQETRRLSYYQLDQHAKAIAAWLQAEKMEGQRIVLLYPAGVEFISALIGCWYAGGVAVPVPCPKEGELEVQRTLLSSIALDAESAAVMTLEAYRPFIETVLGQSVKVCVSDVIAIQTAVNYQPITTAQDSIAYLQYTSGSTSTPKAAIVTHENLQHSLKGTIKAWNYTKTSVTLNWAPHTHVYGLVCGILVPLYHGTKAIIMPPAAFINKPLVWMSAISKYYVSHSGCPNFGYDLCLRHIKKTDLVHLNLASWSVAVNGGDVVQHQTIISFINYFSSCGFTAKQFCSAYGMSELTGAIASTPYTTKPKFFSVSTPTKETVQRQLVSSGKLLSGLHAVAVDSETGLAVAPGEVGEIWLAGKSLVSGYWRRPEENKAVFNARIPGKKQGYFKTGDLGFILANELYLTGRLKEVMIIYGKKYYPLDFEITVANALAPFHINLPQVVFSTEISGKEQIIVVQELTAESHQALNAELNDAICHAITQQHQVNIDQVVFTPKGAIPRTNSGKLQRKKCQFLFNDQSLELLTQNASVSDVTSKKHYKNPQTQFTMLIAGILNLQEQHIDLYAPLSRYAFDSINIIQLTAVLNETYQLALSPAVLYEYPTLAAFYDDLLAKKTPVFLVKQASETPDQSTDIAIIGMNGVFPQAPDLEAFWDNLYQGRDCISEVPVSRWDWHDLTIQWGGFINHVDQFDANFFNISPREAELIDPQQRLFLQTVWKTIEDSGYTPAALSALKTGLFVGVFNHDYAELLQQQNVMDAYLTTGTMNSMIANRISYFLNLRGPSEAIDTACSSSLVAIHQAVHAILQGDCDMAIAGGVNTLITPTSFISATKAGMLSQDGRCKTFDKHANGYVRGEGAGAILLKKLSQALLDGDHIYGVIKGTAVNHGGHVNTLTAPNPNAQAEVIIAACQRAKITVDTIQYIETHGTGTPLGDPIEINGLKKAFQQLAKEQQLESLPQHYCGLGAVKTQIGHLESAAGIAGIIKILLAMHHELIPANLHLNELNPYIEIKDSPFYILDSLTPWPKKNDATPRRAGVSSFGFGGANAHIIVQESPQQHSLAVSNACVPYLITLSAITESALQQRVADLLAWLDGQKEVPNLASISYTLNAGRQHFAKRFCVVVETVAALKAQLQAILLAHESSSELPRSALVKQKNEISVLNNLRDDYLQGKAIDWQQIYGDFQEKISLPTYPFAAESHWIEIKNKPLAPQDAFIDANNSTLFLTAFSKRFTGNEFYLLEHQVNNEPVLPGVVCLEMAREAASRALINQRVVSFGNISWKKPIKKSALQHPVHINLVPQTDFIAFTLTDPKQLEHYVSGEIYVTEAPYQRIQTALTSEKLQQTFPKSQTAAEIYSYFKNAGLSYGPSFQVIKSLYYDEYQVLAELVLPAYSGSMADGMVLHPGLLDGILQTTQALLRNRDLLYLPFAITQMDIYAELAERCIVQVSLVSALEEQQFPVCDIQVTDATGMLLLEITGFSLCAVGGELAPVHTALNYYHPAWVEQELAPLEKEPTGSVLILGCNEVAIKSLQKQLHQDAITLQLDLHDFSNVTVASDTDYIILILDEGIEDNLSAAELTQPHLAATFYLVHSLTTHLIQLKLKHSLQIVCITQSPSIYTRALAGYAKTLLQEQSNLSCRVIELHDFQVLGNELAQSEIQVRYDKKNHRQVIRYEVVPEATVSETLPLLKTAGVYLITGGLGGLGFIFATYLAEHYQAKIILTGRSTLADSHLKMIAELELKGADILYVQADVSCQDEVVALIASAKQRFGSINGIIHAAGVTHDAFITNKTSAEIAAVLAPKIQGSYYLHRATRHEPLEFFVLFSSVAAVFGNPGQSDYAYANCFLDEFAIEREQQRILGNCSGHTRAINWPLWEEGGFTLAKEYRDWLENTLGIVSLNTSQGLTAFLSALHAPHPNCIVLSGNQTKLRAALKQKSIFKKIRAEQSVASASLLRDQVEQFLKNLIAQTLKQVPNEIDAQAPFEQYGIDSLMIIQLNERLEREFTDLPKTLFFEYQNLTALTDYFMENHASALHQLLSVPLTATAAAPIATKRHEVNPGKALRVANQDIAIIGINGRYPQAQDLTEFWDNLKAGKDCISEIPQERWDLLDYFAETPGEAGKSYSKWGGFLDEVDKFDPLFFNISPREAVLMDPQERLFLETAWKTIEDAGYAREQLAGKKVGVYVGVMYGQYQLFANQQNGMNPFVPTNSVFASIANRVSYFFDFHGPSMALDTMCSSSLTAIHLACNSIRNGESQLALAGGVNLSLHPNKYLLLSHGKFLATDGHCRSFGEGGDGYVPGEGVGAVLLKPLTQALADHDHIYAVIKGSQLNHGGKTNGYTVPNPKAQAELIADAYRQAQVSPSQVSYVEAHGTGTALGDPIEIAGLNKAFGQDTRELRCAIGSVKSNIGHCESAAGIAAVTKVVLQLQHQALVPSLLSDALNSNINWATTPFKVQQSLEAWPKAHGLRFAGVSSFGAGGSNAHLILSETPATLSVPERDKSHYLLTLSGKTEQALRQRCEDLLAWLLQNHNTQLAAVSYTLNAGRSHFDYRCALVASSIAEVIQLLQQMNADELPDNLFLQQKPPTRDLAKGAQAQNGIVPSYRMSLCALAQSYIAGNQLDWDTLHSGESQKKIPLPTYPFAKESYWYSDVNQESVTDSEQQLNETITQVSLDKVVALLAHQVKQILKITQHQIAKEKNLGDYGMDSVHFVEFAKYIAAHYQVDFAPTVFYTHSSIASISHYLNSQFPEAIARIHPGSIGPQLITRQTIKPLCARSFVNEDIAIIGMHGLFPQSDDLATFWQHLVDGHDLVTEVPLERWNWQEYFGEGINKSNSRWGGFINNMDQFDAGFFNISAREAHFMDPQQRLFLETVWKTIEDAGYNPFDLATQKVGVFAGVEFSEYQTLIAQQKKELHGFIATGNSHSMIANRVSYFFNFQGPSEVIDTACSSSLVAIHRAIQALRHGECDLALAGGVSLMLNPDTVVVTSQLGALSADGRCKTFDKQANGYVKGEGVGSVLLKPLNQARTDGDTIYAVIKASAVNHGGKAQSLTAPNAKAQSDLLINAYTQANIPLETVTYIETHGTGTALGDPVEIEGLKLAFSQLLTTDASSCRIGLGSVKTNIGHLEPASGIAGVMKLILAMSHEYLPGLLHLNELNPYINLTDSPFYLVQEPQTWQRLKDHGGRDIPLRAGVSSFGFGGTNAHLVLEEGRTYQQEAREQQVKPYYLVTLSAKQQESMQQKISDLRLWLAKKQETVSLASLSFTLNVGRAHFAYRCALVVSSLAELLNSLTLLSNEETPEYCILNNGQTCLMQGPVFDEVYQAAINTLHQPEHAAQYRHKLFILADLYTKHYAIDWQHLYNGQKIRRINSLPSYPFIKQRYWYDLPLNPLSAPQQHVPVKVQSGTDFSAAVLTYLRGIFAEKLHTIADHINGDETYEVYGVDSLIGLEITNRLEQDFGTLPKTLLYERNRLTDLANYFSKNHQEKLLILVSGTDPVTIPVFAAQVEAGKPVTSVLKNQPDKNRDIAIIGLSGTFPMANTMDEFWHNLSTGRDCVGKVPSDRWDYRDYPVQVGGEEKYFPHGGFIPDVDKFDPLFFNISPRDAGFMDPQERLFMQSVWSTLEDAGYTREKLKNTAQNSVGVFAGVTYNFYPLFIAEEWQKGNRVPLDIQSFSVANRISYFLDLNGPSFVVDTACSSSLTAIHLACESILRGDCAMAIAGGVNLSLHPSKYHFLGSFSFMSDQGRCTSFAEGGTGYVPSEGVGSVLLKPLAEAIADNDLIYGVIKSSSMNHGGKTSGYTVPNPNAQAAVIRQALHAAQIDARSISYIEAHGTGTALGDPIEVRGLQDAFETFTEDKQFCAIGSVKSNIGHLESAAGISQLAKVLLQMRHKQLVPTLHTEQLNPFINFKDSPFYVQRELQEWQLNNTKVRRAGVSSFGAGGANVHMIIEEYVSKTSPKNSLNGPYIFLLSALNADRLAEKVQQMQAYLHQHNPLEEKQWLRDISYTLQIGRESMIARLAIIAATREELLAALAHYPQLLKSQMWLNQQASNGIKLVADLATLSLEELSQHWVNGSKIDWQQLYFKYPAHIVSLPTYPFAKRRCWITTKEVEALPEVQVKSLAPSVNQEVFNIEEWLYSTQWEKNPHMQPVKSMNSEEKWLIFSDHELGLVLQQALGKAASIYCFAGEQFERINEHVYYLNPTQKTDYELLFRQINAEHGNQLKGVIYLATALNSSDPAQQDPSLSLLYLFKAMIQPAWHQQLTFALVSQNAQQINADEVIDIWQHHLWSMARIFAAEQASYQVVLIDVDAQERLMQNAQSIVSELTQYQAKQNHLAYRGGERYSIRFTPELSSLEQSTVSPWTAPVAALITGGLGALGYEVAEFLLAQGTRFLLLTGTTKLSSQTPEKNKWLKQLEAKGAQVLYAAVDVANQEKMDELINGVEHTWQQAIDGVFHLAGVTTDNVPIAEMDETLWSNVLQVKVKGALVLHELFKQVPLSSFVLFSSIAAVPHFGMAGLSAYAVANEFISGLALYRRSLNLPAISINWVAWSEKGMSHRHNHDAFLDAVGMASLSINAGITVLDRVLRLNRAEITICKMQWKKFFQVNATAKHLDFFTHFVAEHAQTVQSARDSSLNQAQIGALVLTLLATSLALELDEIDSETPFQHYGMDSIIGINFTAELGQHFPDAIAPMDLYRYPTLKQLTDYIIQWAHLPSEPTFSTVLHAKEAVDIDQLSYEQLNELIEAELKDLELTYD